MIFANVVNKLHFSMTSETRERVCRRIIGPSRPSGSYYLLVCLSAIIATFGLLANSTAVVIGAMLVAPLMGPIFGIALSLSNGDHRLLKTAILAEIAGIALAVSLPALIGLIPLRPDFGSEILSRTQPTIYDILIALASGLAGAYALVDEKISPALPGVAIATALVPPLAACGLNIAAGSWSLAGGAFLLFSVNFIAIEFAAAIVFMISGLVQFNQAKNGSRFIAVLRRLGVSFIILLLAIAFMTQTLANIVKQAKLDNNIRSVLSAQLENYAGARLADVKADQNVDQLEVIATVITPQAFDSARIADMENTLQKEVNPQTDLIVRSVISKDADKNGPVFVSDEELQRRKQDSQEADFMNKVSQVLSDQIKSITGAQVTDMTKDVQEGTPLITVSVRTPQAITPAEVQGFENTLNREMNERIKLVVRSVLTKDANAEQFLDNSKNPNDDLQGADLVLYKNLLNETTWYLSQRDPGAAIARLTFKQDGSTVNVNLTVNTPVTLVPAQVAQMQKHLQATVDPGIEITVKSIVGGTANALEYTPASTSDSNM